MFKRKVLAAFLVMGLALPLPAFAFRPALVPGLPEGVHFELKTEENGVSVLATLQCINPTSSSLHIKVTGGMVSLVHTYTPGVMYPAIASPAAKIPEGAYDVPAHSTVVMAHVAVPARSFLRYPAVPVDSSVQPVSIVSGGNSIARAELDIIPNYYSSPMQPMDGNTIEAQVMVTDPPKPLEDPGDVICLGYPVCYENAPMHIIAEAGVCMDYRWKQLDVILNDVKDVNSNVASTQATVSTLVSKMSSPVKEVVAKPTSTRPTR